MTLDPEQRSQLLRTKLAVLVRNEHGIECAPVALGSVIATVVDGTAYVLDERGDAGVLAGALLWAERQGAARLRVYADDGAGRVARWASYFEFGDEPIEVRSVVGAGSEPTEPEPLAPAPAVPDVAPELLEQLTASGLEVVAEHGIVRGELLGLEVARLVVWPSDVGGDGELHLEAGVGRFDRDAVAAAHPDEPPDVSLARAVRAVGAHRYPGAPAHPLQMLARERWIRADLVADPSLVGASELRTAGMTSEPGGLKDSHPAAAVGATQDGHPLVVVCSSGVDLALVPLAADARALLSPGADLVLALPERDLHPASVKLAAMLREPASLVAVRPGWS